MRLLIGTGGGHVDFSKGLETVMDWAQRGGHTVLASLGGWKGIEQGGDKVVDITGHSFSELRNSGGSFILSSRTNPDSQKVAENFRRYGIDAALFYGGDDTLGKARELHSGFKLPIVGWPKTMDNDTNGSYATIGYTTAAHRAAQLTREAYDTARTHSKIVLLPVFGRSTDWVCAAAADFGHADFVIPAEKKGLTLERIASGIRSAYEFNKAQYGSSFAVVVISEAASGVEGLNPYFTKYLFGKEPLIDNYENPKLQPEILGLAIADALSDKLGIDKSKTALKVATYHLRDGKLTPIDEQFALRTAEECIRLISQGDFGNVATIQDPDVAGSLPSDENLYVNANGKILFVGRMSFEEASKRRPVLGTGFFDYENLKPTEQLTKYLIPLLGQKTENPRSHASLFKPAQPLHN